MRTTDSKPVLDLRRKGDPDVVAVLERALSTGDRVDRWTHGFHAYPAGLHPDAAAAVLDASPGRRVLDPFCGGGTVLVEAIARGRTALGRDLSPIAALVATARTRRMDDEALTRFRVAARGLAERARLEPELPVGPAAESLRPWYGRAAAGELGAIARGVRDVPGDVGVLLRATLSAIVVKASYRRSDSTFARQEVERPPGTTAVLFHKKARELARRLVDLREAVPPETPAAEVREGDARDVMPAADLVLTSPPYPGVYDYLPIQDLRAAWLGLTLPDAAEIGPRRSFRVDREAAHDRWAQAHEAWIHAAAGAIQGSGDLVVVVGDGLVHGQTIDTSRPTLDAARRAGLQHLAWVAAARPDHARASVRWEHAIWMRRARA